MKKTDFLRKATIQKKDYRLFDIGLLEKKGMAKISRLPFSIRILVENLLRKLDGRIVTEKDVLNIARWKSATRARGDPLPPGPGADAGLHRASLRGGSGRHAGGGEALGGDPRESTPSCRWTWSSITRSRWTPGVPREASPRTSQRRWSATASATPCCVGADELRQPAGGPAGGGHLPPGQPGVSGRVDACTRERGPARPARPTPTPSSAPTPTPP